MTQTTTATMPQLTPTSRTPLRRSNQLMGAPTGDLNNCRDNPRLGGMAAERQIFGATSQVPWGLGLIG
jgi:hypothetical protein